VREFLVAVGMMAALAMPASAQINPQQQRMTDCNAQAKGMTGDARQQFMSSCLSNKPAAETKKPNCVNGKPCGNTCIAKDKICHK
jgi:psiF repeat